MSAPDLRILCLADAKLLPSDVQDAFDKWRIWRARDAVTSAVRKRLINTRAENLPTMMLYLERLENADAEQVIFEGIYALAEVVEVNRTQLGLHSGYIVLIMSGQLNPWGLLEFQQDFDHPAPSATAAAEELWRLARQHNLYIPTLLAKVKNDKTLDALNDYYAKKALAALSVPPQPKSPSPTKETGENAHSDGSNTNIPDEKTDIRTGETPTNAKEN